MHEDEYVRAATIDEVVAELRMSRVDLIKIDIEGFEHATLMGAREVLRRFRPMIYLEVQRLMPDLLARTIRSISPHG